MLLCHVTFPRGTTVQLGGEKTLKMCIMKLYSVYCTSYKNAIQQDRMRYVIPTLFFLSLCVSDLSVVQHWQLGFIWAQLRDGSAGNGSDLHTQSTCTLHPWKCWVRDAINMKVSALLLHAGSWPNSSSHSFPQNYLFKYSPSLSPAWIFTFCHTAGTDGRITWR